MKLDCKQLLVASKIDLVPEMKSHIENIGERFNEHSYKIIPLQNYTNTQIKSHKIDLGIYQLLLDIKNEQISDWV